MINLSCFVCLWSFVLFYLACGDVVLEHWTTENYYSTNVKLTEHPGGTIDNERVIFSRDKSPYRLLDDLIIERNAELTIEPGVEIRVEPQVGITVRGIFTAKVLF